MDKKIIFSEGYNKFFKISLPRGTANSGNVNFEQLLFFIGEHKPYKSRNEIGSAYMAIRMKTNDLLGLDWRNRVLRTSKKEVASIKRYYQKSNSLYIKIPFKIAYIFKAISELIEEIHNDGFEISYELQELIGKTYSLAFYKEHIKAYDDIVKDIPDAKIAQKSLNGDFHNPCSPLNKEFK